MHLRFPAVLVSCILLSSTCIAQYTVKRLVFRGSEPYKQQQLQEVAGLTTGQRIGTKEMGEAAQRLMDTGLFADIETTLNGPVNSIDVIFKVKTATPGSFLPVSFENFVWLTEEEREAGVRKRVPLYGGRMPAGSSMQAAVQTALTQMLADKAVQATVETTQEPSTETRPRTLIAYRVTAPKVILNAVHLEGVTPELAPRERSVIQAIAGKPYNEGYDFSLESTLLRPYLDAGFIDAKLADLQRTPSPPEADVVKVTVSARVDSGDQYHLASITWPGSDLFSAEEFTKSNKMQPGDVASDAQLRAAYRPLLNAYLSRGYVDVSIDTHPQEDRAQHTVAYTLSITPSEVYNVGSLSVIGLSPADKALFDERWNLPVSSIYNGVYAFGFLASLAKERWMQPYVGTLVTTAHPDNHMVDVVFTFSRKHA